jgi:carbon monoxide dehydrogenase subunit G
VSAHIHVARRVDAPREAVWAELSRIEDHVEWMADAVELRFHSAQRSGVGTSFSCVTRVGPLTTVDELRIDAWEEGRRIGVSHHGAVRGRGAFELHSAGELATVVTWDEELEFPWWMGASLGAIFARPVLRWIWARNLEKLSARILGT